MSRWRHLHNCGMTMNTLVLHLLGEGNGTPLQYSCLENPMGGGAWQATVHGVKKSQTRLSDFTFTFTFIKSQEDKPLLYWMVSMKLTMGIGLFVLFCFVFILLAAETVPALLVVPMKCI